MPVSLEANLNRHERRKACMVVVYPRYP